MIKEFKTLQKVKHLREDKALRALQAARAEVRKACKRLEAAQHTADESHRTLPDRERAIYAGIIDQIMDLSDLDLVKDRVRLLVEGHQKLLDKVTRARDHLARVEAEASTAAELYRTAQAAVEKIDTLTDDLETRAAAQAEEAEEADVEELFMRPRGLIGATA